MFEEKREKKKQMLNFKFLTVSAHSCVYLKITIWFIYKVFASFTYLDIFSVFSYTNSVVLL